MIAGAGYDTMYYIEECIPEYYVPELPPILTAPIPQHPSMLGIVPPSRGKPIGQQEYG